MWFESVHNSAALSSKGFYTFTVVFVHVTSKIEKVKMGSAISLFTSSDDTQQHPVSFSTQSSPCKHRLQEQNA